MASQASSSVVSVGSTQVYQAQTARTDDAISADAYASVAPDEFCYTEHIHRPTDDRSANCSYLLLLHMVQPRRSMTIGQPPA